MGTSLKGSKERQIDAEPYDHILPIANTDLGFKTRKKKRGDIERAIANKLPCGRLIRASFFKHSPPGAFGNFDLETRAVK